jgi:hypothetical protein
MHATCTPLLINKFKKGYEPPPNIEKDENGDLLANYPQYFEQMEELLASAIECTELEE